MSCKVANEGGTGAGDGKSASYAVIARESGSLSWPRRGDLATIAGEPGGHAYRVLAVDPVHMVALICRAGSTRESWRMPVTALKPL